MIVGIMILGFFIAMLAFAFGLCAWGLIVWARLQRRGVMTEGTVTDYHMIRTQHEVGGIMRRQVGGNAILTFRIPGDDRDHTVMRRYGGTFPTNKLGEVHPVIYDPKNPKHAALGRGEALLSANLVGAVVCAVFLFALVGVALLQPWNA